MTIRDMQARPGAGGGAADVLTGITTEHLRALRQCICPAWDHHTDQQRRAIALANEAADVLERLALAAALAPSTE